MVKAPPVVEVNYWSVCIFLKKSNDFNIVDLLLLTCWLDYIINSYYFNFASL